MADFELRWNNIRLVAWLFGLILAVSFIFSFVDRHYHSPWSDVAASSLDALIIFGFAIARRREIAALFALPHCTRAEALRLAVITGGFLILLTAYFDLLKHLGVPLAHVTDEYRQAGWPVGRMFLMLSLVPAIVEEIAFRGVIQTALERTVNAREAWLIQGALFSVLHLSPLVFPSHFLMGLTFGYLRIKTRSLYPGMALHAGWNALQVLVEI